MSSNWYAESGTALILDEKETIEFCKKYLKEICGRDMLTDLHTNRCRFQDKRTSLKVSEHRYRIFYLRGSGTFLMSESCQL